jgi:hypothetical protein
MKLEEKTKNKQPIAQKSTMAKRGNAGLDDF